MATLIKWIHIGIHRQVWPHITFHNTTCTLERWRVAGNRGPAMVCLTGLSARNKSGLRSPKLPTITEWKLMGRLSRMRSMCHLTGLRRSSIHTVSFRGRSGIVLLNLRLTGFDPRRTSAVALKVGVVAPNRVERQYAGTPDLAAEGVLSEDIMTIYTPFGNSDWRAAIQWIKSFGSGEKRPP